MPKWMPIADSEAMEWNGPEISIDLKEGVIVIYGVRYTIEVFEGLGILKPGTVVRIVKRELGDIVLETLPPGTVV